MATWRLAAGVPEERDVIAFAIALALPLLVVAVALWRPLVCLVSGHADPPAPLDTIARELLGGSAPCARCGRRFRLRKEGL